MSVSSQSTPIYTLDYDTLLHVFTKNANMFLDDKALLTTWTTAQVCRRWRDAMLSTPILVGKTDLYRLRCGQRGRMVERAHEEGR